MTLVIFPEQLQISDDAAIDLTITLVKCIDRTNYAQVLVKLADIIRIDMDAQIKDGADSEENLEHQQNLADNLEALAEQCIEHSKGAL